MSDSNEFVDKDPFVRSGSIKLKFVDPVDVRNLFMEFTLFNGKWLVRECAPREENLLDLPDGELFLSKTKPFFQVKRHPGIYFSKLSDETYKHIDYIKSKWGDEIAKKVMIRRIKFGIHQRLSEVNPIHHKILSFKNLCTSELKQLHQKAFTNLMKKIPGQLKEVCFNDGLFLIDRNQLELLISPFLQNQLEEEDSMILINTSYQAFMDLVQDVLNKRIDQLIEKFELLDFLQSELISKLQQVLIQRYRLK